MQPTFLIKSATLINHNSLQISFTNDWYQENIINLAELVFEKLDHCQTIERVSGADKEYYRFMWSEHRFIVNFECYSQSCWIENEVEISECSKLLTLVQEHFLAK
jgi:hypothetical protein